MAESLRRKQLFKHPSANKGNSQRATKGECCCQHCARARRIIHRISLSPPNGTANRYYHLRVDEPEAREVTCQDHGAGKWRSQISDPNWPASKLPAAPTVRGSSFAAAAGGSLVSSCQCWMVQWAPWFYRVLSVFPAGPQLCENRALPILFTILLGRPSPGLTHTGISINIRQGNKWRNDWVNNLKQAEVCMASH